ncbi:MAG: MFS transporter, partial [Acidimicrobiales bacterium]
LAALPSDARSTIEGSLAAAYKVIGQLPLPDYRVAAMRDAVDHAFLDGLRVGSLVCASIAVGAALVVALLLPARAPVITEEAELEPATA